MKIYIAGPMRGLSQFNFPAFFEAEEDLKKEGHEVFNPARIGQNEYGRFWEKNTDGCLNTAVSEHGFDLRKALAVGLSWICLEAEAVYMLDGWANSKGAVAERAAMEAVGGQVLLHGRDFGRRGSLVDRLARLKRLERVWSESRRRVLERGP